MFEGVLTALVTPFRAGAVDERALQALVEAQISAGVDGLVPCGSTGESATLSHAEHRRVVEIVVQASRGRVAVVAGTGSNSTREAIELTQHAKDVRIFIDEALQRGLPLPLSATHLALLEVGERSGLGDADNSAIFEVISQGETHS